MHLGQVMAQHHFALAFHGQVQGVCVDIRVAVAVAAHPLAHAEKRGDGLAAEFVFQVCVKLGYFSQKRRFVIAHGVFDLIGHGEFGKAQEARLPQLQHACAHQGIDLGQLTHAGRIAAARHNVVARLQTRCNAALCIQNAFALHLGWVCGQHR